MTYERILNTAQKHFAQKGFEGTRVDEIAREARVNKAMIYYHFKNKHDLYRSVFIALAPFRLTGGEGIQIEGRTPREKLGNFVTLMFEVFEGNPEFMRLVQWELAGGPLYMPVFVQEFAFPVVRKICSIIEEGIAEGEFRPIDPFLTYFHILGLVSEYFFFRSVREELYDRMEGMNLRAKFDKDNFIRHLTEFLIRGVERRGARD